MDNRPLKDKTPLMPSSSRWGIFLISFCVLFLTVSVISSVLADIIPSRGAAILTSSALQNVLVFIAPVWITYTLTSATPYRETGADCPVGWSAAAYIAALYLVSFPAMNQIIWWNGNIHLPDAMKGLENSLRAMEEAAEAMTTTLLSDTSVAALTANILIVGILTGLGEETFFRAGLQRLFTGSGMNVHAAVWTAAFIFSAMHFQFFGFIPRMLLGALFGYVYLWSGSIWSAVLFHALNNSIVIIFSWLSARHILNVGLEDACVVTEGFPWLPCVSAATTVLLLWKGQGFLSRSTIK